MTNVSYRAAWQAEYAKDRMGYDEILTWDPFANWESNSAPESLAERLCEHGLAILCGGGDPEQARRFLENCLRIAERTLAERKLESLPWCKSKFPKNRGELLRARTFAQALLGGSLNEAALRQAAADIEEFSHGFPKGKWDDLEEADYLGSVRLALLGGDPEMPARLFKRRRVIRWHAEEYALLKGLADSPQPPPPQPDLPLLVRFDAYFERIRDPKYKSEVYQQTDVLRPELAALRDKYFVSPDGRVDFQRVVQAISR